MNQLSHLRAYVKLSLTLFAATVLLAGGEARAQCPPDVLTSGLQFPLGIAQSNQGNMLVSESGTGAPGSGRITIVDLDGNRRTLLAGLPSGINDVGEPSGPAGLFMTGRTLYLAIGVGDVGIGQALPPPLPPVVVANPNPSSPIFSSVLAIHFSASVEKVTQGFTLSPADQQALASGQKVTLSNSSGKMTINLVVNFPDYILNPLPFFQNNVRLSNPFDLVDVGNHLYVTDGGRNLVWQVNNAKGVFSALATFPPIPNPLPFGPPVVEAVPTGIAYSDGRLLVTLFRGFPFPAGASVVEQVNTRTGSHSPFIINRTAAIDVLPISERGDTDYLVLQFASGPGLSGPGLLLRFETPNSPPTVIASCLITPTSMTLDEKTDTLYVTELGTGRIVAIPID